MKMKWIVLTVFVCLISFCLYLVFSGHQKYSDEAIIKKYLKEKYNIEVVMTHKSAKHSGNVGNVPHTFALKNNRNIEFDVWVYGAFSTNINYDEYEFGKESYKEYKKIKPYLNDIEKLGFQKKKDTNIVQYNRFSEGPLKHTFYIESKKPFNVEEFEEKELDRIFNLIKIIQNSKANISTIRLSETKKYGNLIVIENIESIHSKESLKEELLRYHDELFKQ